MPTPPDFTNGTPLDASSLNALGLWKIGTYTASGTSRALVCDNVFTSDYENYLILYRLQSTLQLNSAYFQYLDTSGNIVNAGYYSQTYAQDYATNGSTAFSTLYTNAGVYVGSIPNLNGGPSMLNANFTVYAPRLGIATAVTGQNVGIRSGAAFYGGQIMSQMTNNQQHRGIRFDNDGGGNLSGKVTIYGYRL
jgi:hypothetical protein